MPLTDLQARVLHLMAQGYCMWYYPRWDICMVSNEVFPAEIEQWFYNSSFCYVLNYSEHGGRYMLNEAGIEATSTIAM